MNNRHISTAQSLVDRHGESGRIHQSALLYAVDQEVDEAHTLYTFDDGSQLYIGGDGVVMVINR